MRGHRHLIAAVAVAMAVACAASGEDVAEPTVSDRPSPHATAVRARPPARVSVEAQVVEAPVPDTVPVHRPDLRVDDLPAVDLQQIRSVAGVSHAAEAASLELTVPTADGVETVHALVIDPESFRPLTPDTTALEPGVWERLNDGNVVFTPAAGNRVQALLGEPIALSGPRATEAVRVGAFAVNGLPPAADLLVPWAVGKRLGAASADTVLVAVSDDADLGAVRQRLAEVLGVEATILEEPEKRQAREEPVGHTTLEAFTYQSVGDGTIRIDPGWVSRNIVTARVPILGEVRCHRVMLEQLAAALAEIEATGLAHLITDYAGCYVPRHILWSPSKPISRHAWGLAFDINVPTNGYGATPTLDRRIVDIFRSWGFKWGGDFATPDGMHFELERIVQVS